MKTRHVAEYVNDKIWIQSWLLFNKLVSRQIKDLVCIKIKDQLSYRSCVISNLDTQIDERDI